MTRPRLALVTGSYRRLGAHIAARLGEGGWTVALHATRAGAPERWLLDRLDDADAHHACFHADLSDPAATAALVPEVAAAFGQPVDLLVNSASCFRASDDTVPGFASLTAHFAVNAAAPFMLAQAVAGDAGPGGAAVVNILDQRIVHPPQDQLAYTLSKQALAEATRTLAVTLAPGTRVNAVAPGLTMPTRDYTPEQVARLAQRMPLGRLPTPDDVADAVLYLARATASTGQTLFVDGGAALERFARDFVHLEREGGD